MERTHLSIGEVLSLLRAEFPDVTISKIRFLESQGLVDPERTPSGYRKFYDHDVERLRWILLQQREHFLPLKVIRDKLVEPGPEPGPGTDDPAIEREQAGEAAAAAGVAEERAVEPPPAVPLAEPDPAPASPPVRERPATPSLFAGLRRPERPEPVGGEDNYTAEELAGAAGAAVELVGDLKQYGLIAPQAVVGGTAYFDDGALAVTRAAAGFARHGIEPRHLRVWRNAADREADLFQQVVLPLLRQRNPEARRQALDTLSELASAGAELRAALVERALRDIR